MLFEMIVVIGFFSVFFPYTCQIIARHMRTAVKLRDLRYGRTVVDQLFRDRAIIFANTLFDMFRYYITFSRTRFSTCFGNWKAIRTISILCIIFSRKTETLNYIFIKFS